MATYQFGDKSAINLMMAIINGLDREFMKRSEFTDITSRLGSVESRLNGLSASQGNGITTIQLNGSRLPVTAGTVSINIPMNLSSYVNDSNYQNAADVRSIFDEMLQNAIDSGLIGQGGTLRGNTVKIKAQPNSVVVFTHPDGTVMVGKADENGDLTVNLPKTGNWDIESVNGNTATTGTVTADGTGEKVADVTTGPTKDNDKNIVTIQTEPNAVVAFVHPDGTVITAKADGNGDVVAVLPETGNWTISVVGNNGSTSNGTVNVTEPEIKDLDMPTTSSTDKYPVNIQTTPGTTIVFTGEDGSTVNVTAGNDGEVYVELPHEGDWDVTVVYPDGTTQQTDITTSNPDTTVSMDITDLVGEEPEQYFVTIKAKPLATVTLVHPDGTMITGQADMNGNLVVVVPEAGNWTVVSVKDGKTEIGEAEVETPGNTDTNVTGSMAYVTEVTTTPGATVTAIAPDGTKVTATADDEGKATIILDKKGDWTVVTTDPDTGESNATKTTVTNDGSGKVDLSEPVTPPSDTKVVTVTGDPNSNVTLVGPNGEIITGTTNANGNFVTTLPSEGDWTVVTKNEDGTTSSSTATVSGGTVSNVDMTGGTKPSKPNAVTITTNPGATVTLIAPDGTTVTGMANNKGVVVLEAPSTGTVTIVSVKDGKSSTSTVTVTGSGNAATTVYPVDDDKKNIPVVIQTAPNADVYAVNSAGEMVTGKADTNGTVTIQVPDDGDWTIVTVKPDGSSSDTSIDIRPGQSNVVDLTPITEPSGDVHPLIIQTAPGSTVTVVKDDKAVSATADENGVAVIKVPDSGSWQVITTKDGVSQSSSVTITDDGKASKVDLTSGSQSNLHPIYITTMAEATVVAISATGSSVSGVSDKDGKVTLILDKQGQWDLLAIKGDATVDKSISIPITDPYITMITASGTTYPVRCVTLGNAVIVAVHEDGTTTSTTANGSGVGILRLSKSGDWTITAKAANGTNKSIVINIASAAYIIEINFLTGNISGGGTGEIVDDTYYTNVYGRPNSTIYAINQLTKDATTSSSDNDGKARMEFPCSGYWRVFTVEGSEYYDGVVLISPNGDISSTRIVGNTGTIFLIYLTTDRGANYTFTHSDGLQVKGQADYDSGFDTVFLPKIGTWTLTTDDGAGKVTTKNVVVENVGELLRVRSKA